MFQSDSNNSMTFKQFFNQKSNSHVSSFVFKNFFRSSFLFLVFGVIITFSSWAMSIGFLESVKPNGFLQLKNYVTFISVTPLVLFFVLFFVQRKWVNNIIGASNNLIAFNYLVLFALYILLMSPAIAGLNFLSNQLNTNIIDLTPNILLIQTIQNVALIFGGSWLMFLVPSLIGYMLKSAKVAWGLMRIFVVSYMIMFALFVIYIVASIFAFGNSPIFNYLNILILILWSVLVFLFPILIIYQMKKVASYINFDNKIEVKKWNAYFTFQVFYGMLYFAMWFIRIISAFRR